MTWPCVGSWCLFWWHWRLSLLRICARFERTLCYRRHQHRPPRERFPDRRLSNALAPNEHHTAEMLPFLVSYLVTGTKQQQHICKLLSHCTKAGEKFTDFVCCENLRPHRGAPTPHCHVPPPPKSRGRSAVPVRPKSRDRSTAAAFNCESTRRSQINYN